MPGNRNPRRAPLAFSISGLMRPFDPPLPLGLHSKQGHPILPDSKSFRSSVGFVGISLILAMRSASAASWASLSSFLSCLAALAATKLRAAAWRFLFGLGIAYSLDIRYISRERVRSFQKICELGEGRRFFFLAIRTGKLLRVPRN